MLKLATSKGGRAKLKELLEKYPKAFFSHVESIMPKEIHEQKETEIRVVFPDYMLSAVDRQALKETDHEVVEMKKDEEGKFTKEV